MDFKSRLAKIENDVTEEKMKAVRLQERISQYTEEKEKLEKILKEKGIDPDRATAWLTDIESKIEQGLSECEKILQIK